MIWNNLNLDFYEFYHFWSWNLPNERILVFPTSRNFFDEVGRVHLPNSIASEFLVLRLWIRQFWFHVKSGDKNSVMFFVKWNKLVLQLAGTNFPVIITFLTLIV